MTFRSYCFLLPEPANSMNRGLSSTYDKGVEFPVCSGFAGPGEERATSTPILTVLCTPENLPSEWCTTTLSMTCWALPNSSKRYTSPHLNSGIIGCRQRCGSFYRSNGNIRHSKDSVSSTMSILRCSLQKCWKVPPSNWAALIRINKQMRNQSFTTLTRYWASVPSAVERVTMYSPVL